MQERDHSKKSMVFYFDWFDNFDGLEQEEITDLLAAIRVYAQYGEHIDGINRVSARILKTMESRIDADFESWLKATNAKRENGLKGGRPPKKAESKETYNNLQEPVYEYDTEYRFTFIETVSFAFDAFIVMERVGKDECADKRKSLGTQNCVPNDFLPLLSGTFITARDRDGRTVLRGRRQSAQPWFLDQRRYAL